MRICFLLCVIAASRRRCFSRLFRFLLLLHHFTISFIFFRNRSGLFLFHLGSFCFLLFFFRFFSTTPGRRRRWRFFNYFLLGSFFFQFFFGSFFTAAHHISFFC